MCVVCRRAVPSIEAASGAAEARRWAVSIKAIPIYFIKLRFNALERAKHDMSEIMYGSVFTAL